MATKLWTEVERYFDGLLIAADPAMDAALKASACGRAFPRSTSPPARGGCYGSSPACRGRARILEIGTLGGYSAIWMASALQAGGRLALAGGRPQRREGRAREHQAGRALASVVEVHLGPALETLPRLAAEPTRARSTSHSSTPTSPTTPTTSSWALRLSRSGSLIVVDNVVREGEVVDAKSRDPNVRRSAPSRRASSTKRDAGQRDRDTDGERQGVRRVRRRARHRRQEVAKVLLH